MFSPHKTRLWSTQVFPVKNFSLYCLCLKPSPPGSLRKYIGWDECCFCPRRANTRCSDSVQKCSCLCLRSHRTEQLFQYVSKYKCHFHVCCHPLPIALSHSQVRVKRNAVAYLLKPNDVFSFSIFLFINQCGFSTRLGLRSRVCVAHDDARFWRNCVCDERWFYGSFVHTACTHAAEICAI